MMKTKAEKETKPQLAAKPQAAVKPADEGWRETIESIAMAVILALLFRGFVAEAFVIPTGSMAPTLRGRHKDVQCPKCLAWYATSGSEEQQDDQPTGRHVYSTTCPICRYSQTLNPRENPNEGSFSGDRIIVGKFSYDLEEPKRWDVIVFKYPGNASVNYIKRLIGLPGERVRIVGGNIYAGPASESEEALRIARKPPHKLEALLQVVDDTQHIPQQLIDVGWPSRWQPWPAGDSAWEVLEGGRSFVAQARDGESWLRYRHLVPRHEDWQTIEATGQLPGDVKDRPGQLISDYYAYNTARSAPSDVVRGLNPMLRGYWPPARVPEPSGPGDPPPPETLGQHWVDDLALESTVEVQSATGELLLMLVRGQVQHVCRIDLATGEARLALRGPDQQALAFVGDDGQTAPEPKAATRVKGPGTYRLRLSNVDHELLLWVNGSVVAFDGPTTYPADPLPVPHHSASDPGDLAPAGIGVRGAAVRVSRLRVLRDKYYIAVTEPYESNDYRGPIREAGENVSDGELIQRILATPDLWPRLFAPENRRWVEFSLDKDQFLPLGDNSPQSYDARYWFSDFDEHHYVERDLLIGKALLIYWPHTWNRPIPFTPNLGRMGPIR